MKKISFEKDIDEMSEEDLAETLADFADKHAENVEAYEEMKSELEEVKAEFSEAKEQLEGRVSRLAEEIADGQSLLSEDELLEYDLERLEEMADSLDLEEAEEEEDDSDEDDAEFMKEDKPSKAGDFEADEDAELRDAAKESLSGLGGLVIN